MVQQEILKCGKGKKYHSGVYPFLQRLNAYAAVAGTVQRSGTLPASIEKCTGQAFL